MKTHPAQRKRAAEARELKRSKHKKGQKYLEKVVENLREFYKK